jgi:hypothetical protein
MYFVFENQCQVQIQAQKTGSDMAENLSSHLFIKEFWVIQLQIIYIMEVMHLRLPFLHFLFLRGWVVSESIE